MSKIVIVGNGVAGDTAANKVARSGAEHDVTVISAESHPFYQRTRLGEILSERAEPDELILHDTEWYESRNISLFLEETVTEINPQNKSVSTASGESFSYDKLLLATGAKPVVPPITGLKKRNVYTLRTLEDVLEIESRLPEVDEAAVIGGGLLGLESAYGLTQRGINLHVIEALPTVMGKQLDKTGSHQVRFRLEKEGIEFRLGAEAARLNGERKVRSVSLSTGEEIPADLVIISVGVSPRTELAAGGGIKTSRGIVVDECLQTSLPDIYAAGDVIEQNGQCYGIWPPAQEQGKIAGKNLLGAGETYDGSLSYYKLKVANIDLISAGVRDESAAATVIAREEKTENTYKKFFLDEKGELIGAILVGDGSSHAKVLNGLRKSSKFEQLNKDHELIE